MNTEAIEYQYDQEVKSVEYFLNDLRKRRKVLEVKIANHTLEDTDAMSKQLKYLDKLINTLESMFALTQIIRTHYWSEAEKMLDVRMDLEKEKLLNSYLTKQLSDVHNGDRLLAMLYKRHPWLKDYKTIRVDYTCIEHKVLGCKACRNGTVAEVKD